MSAAHTATEGVNLLDDLEAEGQALDGLVTGLADEAWHRITPSPGWTVAHQVSHLAWTDEWTVLAARDPDEFRRQIRPALADPVAYLEEGAARGVTERPRELLTRWREGRRHLLEVMSAVPGTERLPWFGPSMGPASMLTGRLMETWAHGQDVADALGLPWPPAARLRHVADLAVRTRDFAFATRGLPPPPDPMRVRLLGPQGERWSWGPEGADQQVWGSALDFCLLATRRRHRSDLELGAAGPDADRWLDIAQAYAGDPGQGRRPGQFG